MTQESPTKKGSCRSTGCCSILDTTAVTSTDGKSEAAQAPFITEEQARKKNEQDEVKLEQRQQLEKAAANEGAPDIAAQQAAAEKAAAEKAAPENAAAEHAASPKATAEKAPACSCGQLLAPNAKFCNSCGKPVQDEASDGAGAGYAPLCFTMDAHGFQKEAREYYTDPTASLCTELVQNSLDACAKQQKLYGGSEASADQCPKGCDGCDAKVLQDVQHHVCRECDHDVCTKSLETGTEMKMRMQVFDRKEQVKTGEGEFTQQNRVIVRFEDNGMGMDESVIREGLLKIACSGKNSHAGAKTDLGSTAGGFGLAKVLLFLGQDSFKIYTKMKNSKEVIEIRADPGRLYQSYCEFKTVKDNEVIPATLFKKGDDSHGTWIEIVLNPWVMRNKENSSAHSAGIEEFIRDQTCYHATANHFIARFKEVLMMSHLPVDLKLNEEPVLLEYDLGVLKAKAKLAFTERECASIYCKDGDPTTMPVVLEVLSDLPNQSGRPYFLFVYEDPRSQVNDAQLMPTLLLHSRDQQSKPFQCEQLLDGARSKLKWEVSFVACPIIDRLVRDPTTFPPAAEVLLLTPRESASSMGSFACAWEASVKAATESKPYSWWVNLTKEQATAELGGGPWREKLGFRVLLNREEGVKDSDIGSAFQGCQADIQKVSAKQLQQLELYGGIIHQILDTVSDKLPLDVDCDFDLGFHFSARNKYQEDVKAARIKKSDRPPLYVISPLFGPQLPDDDLSAKNIWQAIVHFRLMAFHQVAHSWGIGHNRDFWDRLGELRVDVDFAESHDQDAWTWFNVYKRSLVTRYFRDVQDEVPQSTKLVDHLFSLQKPCWQTLGPLLTEELRLAKENSAILISGSTCGESANVATVPEAFKSMPQQVADLSKKNKQKDMKIERMMKELEELKKHMKKEMSLTVQFGEDMDDLMRGFMVENGVGEEVFQGEAWLMEIRDKNSKVLKQEDGQPLEDAYPITLVFTEKAEVAV